MTRRVLFAGGRIGSLRTTGAPTEITTAGRFDAAYADCAIDLTSATGTILSADFKTSALADDQAVVGETLFVHFETYGSTTATAGRQPLIIYDTAGYPWLAIQVVSNGNFQFYYNTGTGAAPAWTALAGTAFVYTGALTTYDIALKLGSPHTLSFAVNGTANFTVTFTQDLFTTARRVDFREQANSTSIHMYLSQIICTADMSTIGGKLKTLRPTAAGTYSQWTGAVTDVNEAVNSDTTTNSTTAAGQKQTYALADVTVPVGYAIAGVWHWCRAKSDGANPSNIKSLLRAGGVDYLAAANMVGMGLAYGPVGQRYDTDPATGLGWTQAGVNGLEIGYQSAA